MATSNQRQDLIGLMEPTLGWLRLAVVALAVLALLIAGAGVWPAAIAWLGVALASAYAYANSSLCAYKVHQPRLTRRVIAGVDLSLITLLIAVSGGAASPLVWLYSLPIVVGVVHHGIRVGAQLTLAASLLYATAAALWSPPGPPVWIAHVGLLWSLFLLLGYLTLTDGTREEKARKRDELAALQRAAAAPMHTGDMRTVIESLLTSALGPTHCTQATIYLYDQESHSFTTRYALSAAQGRDRLLVQESAQVPPGDYLFHLVYSGASKAITEIADDRRARASVLNAEGVRSALVLPLIAPGGTRVGVLILGRSQHHRVSQHDRRFAGTLAMQASVAIRSATLFEEAASLEAAKEADRLRSQLLATVSHELRTPITAIQGFAFSLKGDEEMPVPPEVARDWLNEIEQNAERLVRLVGDLLDLSQLESGALRMNLERQYFEHIVDELHTNLEILAGDRRLTIQLGKNLPMLCCDSHRIGQVLCNLVGNAAKFSPPGSNIVVGAERHEGNVLVGVRDEGEGIPLEFQEKVFERFFQVEGQPRVVPRGTGLGLAICRNIVEAHGGRIWVESSPGRGTIMYVTLPGQAGRIG